MARHICFRDNPVSFLSAVAGFCGLTVTGDFLAGAATGFLAEDCLTVTGDFLTAAAGFLDNCTRGIVKFL